MTNFPSPIPPDRAPTPKRKNRKALWILLAVAAVLLLLLFLIPELFVLIALFGIILAIIGLVKGKIPWLPIHGRKKSGLFAGAMVVLMFICGAIMGPSETTAPPAAQPTNAPLVTSTESPTPTPSESASPTAIADFVGQDCKGDELVMEQGAEKLYCDENASGVLVWATQDDHDKAIVAAKKAAAEKAAKEKAAAEKKEAEAKAIAEKKAAEKKAADKKAAEAKAEREAEQAAAAEAERRAAEKAEQEEAARLAELEEEQQSYVSYANCTEARAAGAAPISIGEPGYASHLDRDGDGIGCDS
ncbi:excalibur calcium-binding domain-containing protein (plasmid) [Glutamicibacter mishrai]|uniref:excalibur calcium-binding domain-containing protein n=1 Tax=Glutamicibacter mishrai TaxID=1775880 RepID=UPI0032ED0768